MSAPQRPGPQPPWPQQQPYQPGQTEWIPRVQEPRRDEPFRFEEPAPEPPPNPVATWALRIGGLVAIAVISGFVWALLNSGTPEQTPGAGDDKKTEVPAGRFTLTPHEAMPNPKRDTDCAANSYGKVEKFFEAKPCVNLVRALYTSKPPNQDRVIYTWVAVVTMPDETQATELYELAKKPRTGNVNDPLKAGLVEIDGLDSLGGGEYASQLNKSHVIIVESDYEPGDGPEDEELLLAVSADAIRFGTDFINQG